MNNSRPTNVTLSHGSQSTTATTEPSSNNEEDQLTRINLQALQNRDPYITKILDQAQRVCVFKFSAEKRQWERKDLEGTLFVYERSAPPFHGFVILSTVSRETFVQIIKPSMEFKHTPSHDAFLQYKVDVGDIYGIWFISKNDCPRVTECLTRLTAKAKELEESKSQKNPPPTVPTNKTKDIFSLLNQAQEKFQDSKRKQEPEPNETSGSMPPLLVRLFSTQDTAAQSTINKPALSVSELEKQLLQPSVPVQEKKIASNSDNLPKPLPQTTKETPIPTVTPTTTPQVIPQVLSSSNISRSEKFNTAVMAAPTAPRLMTPADFQRIQPTSSPVLMAPIPIEPSLASRYPQPQISPTVAAFTKEDLRQCLLDMLRNDEEFVTGLYNAYAGRHHLRYNRYS